MTKTTSEGGWVGILQDEHAGMSSSGLLWRLLLLPAVALVVFFGGVYWVRIEIDAAGATSQSSSMVQIRLLPQPEPDVIPVAVATQPVAVSASGVTTGVSDRPSSSVDQSEEELPFEASAPTVAPTKTAGLPSSASSTANPESQEFKNTLLRHIARFQRYPKAAERKRLQGTVRVVFSAGRSGRVIGAWVTTSSGESVLDQEALDTIRRAQPLPSIPSVLPDPIRIELALGFDPP